AEWLLYLAPMIRAGLLHVPFGTGRHAPIAAEDQARVIVGILESPSQHGGKAYPLYGPVEFTYQGISTVLSRLLGKEVQYKQVSIETMLQMMASGGQKPPAGHNARALYGEFEQVLDRRAGDSFAMQHLREVAIDHQNGVFAGTNDLVETIGGRPATTLEAFIDKHRAARAGPRQHRCPPANGAAAHGQGARMKNLLSRALEAHGGLSRWRKIEAFQLKVSIGGGLWRLKGLPDGLRDVTLLIQAHRPIVRITPFGGEARTGHFAPDRVWVEDADGGVVEERATPRASFAGHVLTTP